MKRFYEAEFINSTLLLLTVTRLLGLNITEVLNKIQLENMSTVILLMYTCIDIGVSIDVNVSCCRLAEIFS